MSRSVIFALLVLFLILAGAFAADPVEELAEALVEALVTPTRTSRPSRPSTTRPRSTRPRSTRPRTPTTRPRSTRPRTSRPSTRRPSTRRPSTQRPSTQRPRTRRPTTTKPSTRRPSTQRPKTQKPKTQKPSTRKPSTQRPRTNKPATQKPSSQAPRTSKPTSAPRTTKPSTPETGNRAEKSLNQIFKHEGKCQNWKSDSGNKFQGSIGYTCNGIIPSVGYNNRNGAFSYAAEKCKNAGANFVKCAHDADPAKFKEGAAQVYRDQYFKPAGCTNLKMPAYYLCADIAVNSGVGRAKQYLREIGNVSDPKELARKLNEKHRADYVKWSASGPNAKFRQGWLSRADNRASYINNYQGDE